MLDDLEPVRRSSSAQRAADLWEVLAHFWTTDPEVTITGCTHFLDAYGAGTPDVPMIHEEVRKDATFWASCAHQFELEAYAAASIMAMEKTPLTQRAVKRLAAFAVQQMDAETKAKFREWINQ